MRATDLLSLVRRLLIHEATESQDPESLIEAAERVLHKLRMHLSKRIGQEGFRTLLARALTLTTAQFPHLIAVRIETDGSLIGLREAAVTLSRETGDNEAQTNAVEGAVALVAHLLGLMTTFIGEDLTRRLLSTVWPEFTFNDTTSRENDRL